MLLDYTELYENIDFETFIVSHDIFGYISQNLK